MSIKTECPDEKFRQVQLLHYSAAFFVFDVRHHHVQLVGHMRPDNVALPLAG